MVLVHYYINFLFPVLISSPILQKVKLDLEGLSGYPTVTKLGAKEQAAHKSAARSEKLCLGENVMMQRAHPEAV